MKNYFTIFSHVCVCVWMYLLCMRVKRVFMQHFLYLQHLIILKWAIKALDFRLFKFIQSAGVHLCSVVILSQVVRCTRRTSVVIDDNHRLAKLVLRATCLHHLRMEVIYGEIRSGIFENLCGLLPFPLIAAMMRWYWYFEAEIQRLWALIASYERGLRCLFLKGKWQIS